MLHLDDIGPRTPRLPHRRTVLARVTLSAAIHVVMGLTIIALARTVALPPAVKPLTGNAAAQTPPDVRRVVFLVPNPRRIGTGGGGGGNRQPGPIRRAQATGADGMTLPVKKRGAATAALITEVALPAQVVLDAKPLASGTFEQVGLPTGGVPYGISTGPGSGGGVGEGTGTGIGSGRGPGIGPGSGGGMGGGIYRPGGAVTPPRVITEVKPTYTDDALLQKIQGTVVLELVITRDGRPSQIRVVRSLDPTGLDGQAVMAAAQWRFEPGRLAGTPVDVLVTVMLDFWIR